MAAFADAKEQRIPLPDHSALVVTVPDHWELRPPSSNATAPVILFTPNDGPQFEFSIALFTRNDKSPKDFATDAQLRRLVDDSAKELQPTSLENPIPVMPMGDAAPGFYLWASERKPWTVTYKFQLKGTNLVTFSYYGHDGQLEAIQQALAMMRTAKLEGG